MRTQQLKRAGWAGIAAFIIAGCASDRAAFFSPEGPTIFNFPLLTSGAAATLPAGSLRERVYDPGVTNDSAVRFVARNLAGLSTGVYQVWLADSALGTVLSPNGRVVMHMTISDGMGGTMRDSTEMSASANSFNPSTNTYDSVVVEVRQSTLGQNPRAFYNAMLTIEASAASSPSTALFLFRRRSGGTFAGSFVFGNFGGSDRANDVPFVASGNGQGGVRGGEELSVDVFELVRPPVGFFYEGWLFGGTNGPIRVGELTSAYPERASLVDADINRGCTPAACEPNTNATQIISANVRNTPSAMGLPASGSFCGSSGFQLMLQPKAASGFGIGWVVTSAFADKIHPLSKC